MSTSPIGTNITMNQPQKTCDHISDINESSPFTKDIIDLFFDFEFIKKRSSFIIQLDSSTKIRSNFLEVVSNLGKESIQK